MRCKFGKKKEKKRIIHYRCYCLIFHSYAASVLTRAGDPHNLSDLSCCLRAPAFSHDIFFFRSVEIPQVTSVSVGVAVTSQLHLWDDRPAAYSFMLRTLQSHFISALTRVGSSAAVWGPAFDISFVFRSFGSVGEPRVTSAAFSLVVTSS